jgi:hypothetical protein
VLSIFVLNENGFHFQIILFSGNYINGFAPLFVNVFPLAEEIFFEKKKRGGLKKALLALRK